MQLYEASWPDSPSLLLNARSIGQAIQFIKDHLGIQSLYELNSLNVIHPDNFVLVGRKGMIQKDKISLHFCPNSQTRVFQVRRFFDQEEAILIVSHISELPALILWHFDYISEKEYTQEDRTYKLWQAYNSLFSFLEINTYNEGILLKYNCEIANSHDNLITSPLASLKQDLE